MLVFACISALAWLGFAAEKTKVGKMLTGLFCTAGSAIVLSNMGVLPFQSQAYEFVMTYLVPMAIPLFLFRVNLKEIFQETGRTIIAFTIGAFTTVIGIVICVSFLDLGPLESDLAGLFAAGYIGGALNFASASEAIQFPDPTLLSAGIAADGLAGFIYIMVLAVLPSVQFLTKVFGQEPSTNAVTIDNDKQPITLFSIISLLAASALIVSIGNLLSAWLGMPSYAILFITAISLLPSTLFANQLKGVNGGFDLGMICTYLFFAAVGASANLTVLLQVAPTIMLFAILVIVIHAVLLFPIARAFKLSLGEVIIASNACILGPTTAAALAAARGWRHLVTPGLLAGLFGYAIGTFIGVTVAAML
ncbi:DUF819 family protein [Bowmanella pacifica]|nr:DUF819 family protein [Bowmanella pacifica]